MTAKSLYRHALKIAAILTVLVCAGAVEAATIYVSGMGNDLNDGTSWEMAKQTVQAGLDVAMPEDQVWVAAGMYVEHITLRQAVELYGGFAGAETDLAQRDWMTNQTILDGDGAGTVVRAPSGLTALSKIDGFFITNGYALGVGGGIFCSASSPTISNNLIYWNTAGLGGGIACSGGSATIEDNYIIENSATTYGGGIYCTSATKATISNNWVTSNTAASGGGIYCTSASTPTITDNMIMGNSTSGTSTYGGGIYCNASSPTILKNQITDNSVSGTNAYGGGIYCGSSTPTVAHNTISNNSVSGGNSYGGGVCSYLSSPVMSSNAIAGNTARYGGGIYCSSSASPDSPMMLTNAITGNTASSGAGIYCSSTNATVANNAITANNASYAGGGIYSSAGTATIANNTIVTNGASTAGGGIYSVGGTPTIANTIVAFNSSGIFQAKTGTPSLRYNCVYGNTTYNFSGLIDPTGTNGNISADPKLAAIAYGNIHIQPDSPCVDTGDDAVASSDWIDIDGQSRIAGSHVDIGADESDGTVWSEGTSVIVRVRPDGNDTNDGSSWKLAKKTVEAGVAAVSMTGGEVWVQAGTYNERITLPPFVYLYGGFSGKETGRTERNWAANVTILDGQQGGSVVTALAGDRVSTIDGFTIRNGLGTASEGYSPGGGIYCSYASPIIVHNTITANAVTGTYGVGGGISCAGGSPVVMYNTIAANSASYSGGGISSSGGAPTIANNTVAGNSAYGNAGGGGIYCSGGSPAILNNAIAANTASYAGGAIYCAGGSPIISNNRIGANNATYSGGGISCVSGSPTIANNMITANSAYNGGGIDCGTTSPTIANNTIAGNSAYAGGGIYLTSGSPTIANTIVAFNSSGICQTKVGTPSLRSNCVYGNTSYNYSGLTDPTGTNGNIATDPKFAGVAYGNMHIQPDSPCVDAGDDLAARPDAFDIDGQPRMAGTHVDIGADESDGTVWPAGPYAIVRVSPDGSDANDGSTWPLAKRTVQAGLAAALAQGGEVWVQAGTYNERITLPPFVYLYGGFSGKETMRTERNWVANVTILDGEQGGSVVSARAGDRVSTIDGFTIRNGKSTSSVGGGIYCSYASPLIANNTITGNSATYHGGGISCSYSSPTILNNIITANSAVSLGGGVYCYNYSSPAITNNTIVGNTAISGGAVYCASTPAISNNIMAFNSSGVHNAGGSPVLHNNCVYNPDGANYTNITAGAGSISVDPLFADAEAGGLSPGGRVALH